MQHPEETQRQEAAAHAPAPGKKALDPIVKLGLGVLAGAFLLIWGGMFLTRPDRSIPPFSIGAQEGPAVAIHVPSWTSDAGIEALIHRFRKVGRATRDFGPMKIRPTTPGDPAGRYRRITIYVFTHDAWAESEMLHRYLAGDPAVREPFEKAVRGFYRLEGDEEEGRIGPIRGVADPAGTAAYARGLFKGPVTTAAADEPDRALPPELTTRSPSPRPGERAAPGL